jgi:hypothetical protein
MGKFLSICIAGAVSIVHEGRCVLRQSPRSYRALRDYSAVTQSTVSSGLDSGVGAVQHIVLGGN